MQTTKQSFCSFFPVFDPVNPKNHLNFSKQVITKKTHVLWSPSNTISWLQCTQRDAPPWAPHLPSVQPPQQPVHMHLPHNRELLSYTVPWFYIRPFCTPGTGTCIVTSEALMRCNKFSSWGPFELMGFKVQSRDGDSQCVKFSQLLINAEGILPADLQE